MRQLFLYVLSIGLISLQISCKDELSEVQNEEIFKEEMSHSSASRTFSGDSLILENPYSTENMTAVFLKLKDNNPQSAVFKEVKVHTTHQYLKFSPENEEEVGLLKSDSTIHYFDYRLDAEYKDEFLANRSPDADSIPVYYTAVPVGMSLPDVKYEVLSDLYIPEQDPYFSDIKDYDEYEVKGKVENKTDLFNNLVYYAFEKTGNEEELLTENATPQARWIFGSKWRPSGSVRVQDDIAGVRPVTGAQILMRQWFTVDSGITDGNGNFQTGTVRGKARYVIQWERYHYSVRDGSIFQAETHGPNVKQQSWHPLLSGGKDEYHALIHQAAHDFYYGNRFGLISPPMNNHFYNFGRQSQIKIAARLTNSGPTSSYSHVRSEITFGLSAQIHIKDYGKSSDQVYGTTIHELSHALHSVKDRFSYDNIVRDSFLAFNSQVRKRNRRLLESWPTAVEILMTLERYRVRYNLQNYSVYQNLDYRNYQNRSIAIENLYTSGIYDMTDIVNQRASFGNTFPIDRVNGYTIKELENALPGARYWNDYRDKVKAMYPNKATRPFVDELFANWQD
nr:hypothetical protein [uncultured Chryseobacterium sp.]